MARSAVPVVMFCLAFLGAPQGGFRHCGPSASYAAAFDPRSRQIDATGGILYCFAVVEWAPSLPFPALAHNHAGDRREGRMNRIQGWG